MKQLNKVLVVDDDLTARFLIERTLKRTGISQQILTAKNGKEALDVLNTVCLTGACPELIFLDINMPIMDGFEFLEALQSSGLAPLPSKIVLLTSSSNPYDMVRAKNFPVAAYLSKPLTDTSLKALLV